MAFVKKTWKDRISQFPNRRTVNDGYTTKQVTVGRDEGTITEEGDSFDAANMNDLEQRIEDAYGDISQMVADEVAQQYDSNSVIFDNVATEGHGVGFVVSSDYIANLKVEDLKDVDISSPQPNQALVFDFTDPDNPKIVNGEVSTVGGLNDLNDVTIDDNTLAEGQELVYNDTDEVFENKTTRVELTQAEYDALVSGGTVLPNVDYYITDAPSMSGSSKDLSFDGTTKSTYQAINEKANSSDLSTVATSGSYADLSNKPIAFRGTLGLDVMQVMKDLPDNAICCYTDSNNPTNQPTGHAWGSYFMYKTNGGARAYYTDNDCFAVSSRVTSSSTSMTWKIFT